MAPPAATGSPWQGGDAYERFMGRWSRRLVPPFGHFAVIRFGVSKAATG